MALTGSPPVAPAPEAVLLPPEAPCGPERGGFAQRSFPCAILRLPYSGLFLTPSMALMALEILVKLTKAQFLSAGGAERGQSWFCQV